MTEIPLRKNRDFLLLQAGQLLSTTGTQTAVIAYPLLVLTMTDSPALAGLVAFARVLPAVLFSLLAGVAADRFDRKLLLILSDTVRAVAVGSLVVAILLDALTVGQILVVACVEGSFAALFSPAATGALRSLVPAPQLPAAVGTQQARSAAASLAGPPLGGALFGFGKAVPFLVDALSYVFSVVSLLLIRTPFQESRTADPGRLRIQLAEGWHFLWHQPFLRTTTFLYGLTNFIGPGVLLAIVVIGERQGLSGASIGVLLAAFSGCLLVGSLLSGFARRVLPARAIMLLELWMWPIPLLFLICPNVYVLAGCVLPAALAAPSTDSVVIGYRLAVTPDRMVGRVESVRSTIALALAPVGSLTAGLLLSTASERVTIAVFAAVGLPLAVWGTVSSAIRMPAAPDRSSISVTKA
jgi:MFS family permease